MQPLLVGKSKFFLNLKLGFKIQYFYFTPATTIYRLFTSYSWLFGKTKQFFKIYLPIENSSN